MEVGTHIELWHLLTACGAVVMVFLTVTVALGKMLVHQFKEHVDEKFEAMEKTREESTRHWNDEFKKLDDTTHKLQMDFLNFKAELPVQYVRREDYMRGMTVIEAKLDALYSKLEVVQIQGAKNDR